MEDVDFDYYNLTNRFFAVFDKIDPNRIIILMDLNESIYGKNNRAGPFSYHDKFNGRMLEILEIFKKDLNAPSLKLDGFHYNFMR